MQTEIFLSCRFTNVKLAAFVVQCIKFKNWNEFIRVNSPEILSEIFTDFMQKLVSALRWSDVLANDNYYVVSVYNMI